MLKSVIVLILKKEMNRLIKRIATLHLHTQSQNKECANLSHAYIYLSVFMLMCVCVSTVWFTKLRYIPTYHSCHLQVHDH